MLKSALLITVLLVIAAALAQANWGLRDWLSDLSFPYRYGITKKSNLMLPMRDGTQLNSKVFLPTDAKDPVPTILMRTTYGGHTFDWIKFFVNNGYAVVLQNVRGRYGSEGKYISPHRYSRTDGYDTIDWIVKQPWSTEKVGTFGCSYLGENQIILAAANHPNHIAMIADGAGGAIGNVGQSYGYFGVYENGVLNLASALGWNTSNGAIDYDITPVPPDLGARLKTFTNSLPVATLDSAVVPYATGYADLVQHSLTDNWWQAEGYIDRSDTFSAATLHVNTWYDQTVHDSFRLAQQMAENAVHPRAKNQHLLVGPGIHCSSGKLKEGNEFIGKMEIEYVDIEYKNIYLGWFDYWLKNQGKMQLPPIQYYLIHSSSWRTAQQWPPKDHENLRLYIDEKNRLSYETSLSENLEANRYYEFQYDPNDPVQSLGGPICCTFRDDEIAGAVDQTPLKNRNDVLLFESDTLPEAIDLVGSVRVLLHVSTDARDTDFTLKIVDQTPEGPAYNLQDGVVRLRYRSGIANPELAVPGTIYPVTFELRPIAYRFQAGHKIAVYISSSNFPRLARNLNTGEDSNQSTLAVIANNRVYYSAKRASYIELPITQ